MLERCETQQPGAEATLGVSEIQDMYSVLAIVASNESIPEAFRLNLLNWAIGRQRSRLQQC